MNSVVGKLKVEASVDFQVWCVFGLCSWDWNWTTELEAWIGGWGCCVEMHRDDDAGCVNKACSSKGRERSTWEDLWATGKGRSSCLRKHCVPALHASDWGRATTLSVGLAKSGLWRVGKCSSLMGLIQWPSKELVCHFGALCSLEHHPKLNKS